MNILEEVQKVIDDCSEKDWDGYDGEPLSQDAMLYPKFLITRYGYKFPCEPFVVPNSKGVIQLEFEKDGKFLEIECTAEWHYLYGVEEDEDTWKEGSTKNPEWLFDAWNSL